MSPEALIRLAERVEQASADIDERGHRELSAAVAHAIGWEPEWQKHTPVSAPWAWCPTFTASLDAAMSLVPEGMIWGVVNSTFATPEKAERGSGFVGVPGGPAEDAFQATAATPALALTAAALRARAAQESDHVG